MQLIERTYNINTYLTHRAKVNYLYYQVQLGVSNIEVERIRKDEIELFKEMLGYIKEATERDDKESVNGYLAVLEEKIQAEEQKKKPAKSSDKRKKYDLETDLLKPGIIPMSGQASTREVKENLTRLNPAYENIDHSWLRDTLTRLATAGKIQEITITGVQGKLWRR